MRTLIILAAALILATGGASAVAHARPASAQEISDGAPAGLPPCSVIGDLNDDHAVGATDALLVFQLYLRIVTTVPCEIGGQVNGDGVVNARDALVILQYVAGIIPSLPA